MKHRQGGFLIAKVHQLAGRVFARMLRERGIEINPAQGRIIYVLWQGGEMPIQELARRTSLGKSTLTTMLDRLERAGQVRRVPSKVDRRAILIELTAKSRQLENVYQEVSAEMAEKFYKGFSDRESDAFERYLTRILDNLKELEESQP